MADWGTKDPSIGALLDKLQGSTQIPFLAIFPANRPAEVIRVPGLYTRAKLIKLMEDAGITAKDDDAGHQAATTSSDDKQAAAAADSRNVEVLTRLP